MSILGTIGQGLSKAGKFVGGIFTKDLTKGTNVQKFEVPVTLGFSSIGGVGKGAVSAGKGAFSTAKNILGSISTFAQKKSINPAAGVTGIKNIGKAVGKAVGIGALAGGLFGGARIVSKSIFSGKTPTIGEAATSVSKSAGVGASIGLSPLGGLTGSLEGTSILTGDRAKQAIQNLFGLGKSKANEVTNSLNNLNQNLSNFTDKMPQYTMPTMANIYPQTPVNITLQEPQTPQLNTPTFSPALSISGGASGSMFSSESLPLLLLLLGGAAGVGGYALGRRKRKRKKYKKRRR